MKEGLRLPQPMSEGGERLDYASSGVDIDLEGASVASLVGALSRSVRAAGTPGAPVDLPGGFGGGILLCPFMVHQVLKRYQVLPRLRDLRDQATNAADGLNNVSHG